jgi:hypothetical protein
MSALASEHFGWAEDSSIVVGKTAIGRAAVATLQMNPPLRIFLSIGELDSMGDRL